MEDLIACLYPYNKNELARQAVKKRENASRVIEAREKRPELLGRESRETTAPPDDNVSNIAYEETPDYNYEVGLQLTFSHGPKGSHGFVIGTEASSCDIVVAKTSDHRVSRRHCYITFDAQRRLIVRDCSSNGTIVEYDKKGGDNRRNFTWIIGGHDGLHDFKELVIKLDDQLQFQVVVSKSRFPEIFLQNVDQFRAEIAVNNELPFGALGLQSAASTAGASGTQTPEERGDLDMPNKKSILFKRKKLGHGTFSVVTHVWDVSTGLEYASKKFLNPSEFNWVREAMLMKKISHKHLTQLVTTIQEPSPRLILEYLPLGNLEHQHRQRCFSINEVIKVLYQGLLALTYLHEQKPPFSHRDIKPENILMLSRDPLHIKLADFGLSKANNYLATVCGTPTYLAPELAQFIDFPYQEGFRYNSAVDIWALGVVVYEYAYGLPRCLMRSGLSWCQAIINALGDWDSDALLSLLSKMIVMDPGSRQVARKCLYSASQLFDQSCSPTPSRAAGMQRIHSEDDDASTTVLSGAVMGIQETSPHDKCEDYSTYQASTKRQRSPAVDLTSLSPRTDQTKRRQSEAGIQEYNRKGVPLGQLYSDIVKLFTDLKMDVEEGLDDETKTLVEELCKRFRGLNVTKVGLAQGEVSSQTTVHVKTESEEIVIATLTSSEVLCPPAELATHLLTMLHFWSSQPESRTMASADKADHYTNLKSQELKNFKSQTCRLIDKLSDRKQVGTET